jgi:hypothetical protein
LTISEKPMPRYALLEAGDWAGIEALARDAARLTKAQADLWQVPRCDGARSSKTDTRAPIAATS